MPLPVPNRGTKLEVFDKMHASPAAIQKYQSLWNDTSEGMPKPLAEALGKM